MANPIKQLIGQTAIYGLSSIVGRLLNYLLVPIVTRAFLPETYGIVAEFYAYVGFFFVFLTYGLETGFFRFAEKTKDFNKVFSTAMSPIVLSISVFILFFVLFAQPVAEFLNYPHNKEYVIIFALIIGFDVLQALPFAKLRFEKRPIKFAVFKLSGIFLNIFIQLFFVAVCKDNDNAFLSRFHISSLTHLYNPEIGIGYIFYGNLIASGFTMLLFVPDLLKLKYSFSKQLLKQLMIFSLPLLIVNFSSIANETIDRILIKYLIVAPDGIADPAEYAMAQLGIYSAVFKISVLMTLFTQAFRYAAEPFFFAQEKEVGAKKVYADIMKYFVIFGLVIFLGVILYIDIFKYFIDDKYWGGLYIIPILLAANLFLGVVYNLSFWYKLSDRTKYGALIAVIGALITILFNVILIPIIGYLGSAWAHFTCYFTMMLVSFFMGRKFYRINYPLKEILVYVLIALLIFVGSQYTDFEGIKGYIANSGLFLIFVLFVIIKEKIYLRFVRRK